METEVVLNTYTGSGKWYTELKYKTSIEVWNTTELVEEAASKTNEKNFTIEASCNNAVNRRLVII